MRRVLVATTVLLVLGLWLGRCRPSGEPTGTLLDWSGEPAQTDTSAEPITVETRRGRVVLQPRASYEIVGMVIGVERYRFDGSAFLAPLDVALAWGPVPDWRDRISFQQMGRFVHWQTRDGSLDLGQITSHVANTHVIPANSIVERAVVSLDRGEAVRLAGLLVDASGADGFRWRTSLSRSDTDAGACELLWLESVEVGGRLIR